MSTKPQLTIQELSQRLRATLPLKELPWREQRLINYVRESGIMDAPFSLLKFGGKYVAFAENELCCIQFGRYSDIAFAVIVSGEGTLANMKPLLGLLGLSKAEQLALFTPGFGVAPTQESPQELALAA